VLHIIMCHISLWWEFVMSENKQAHKISKHLQLLSLKECDMFG
jgi:hypothetical protein